MAEVGKGSVDDRLRHVEDRVNTIGTTINTWLVAMTLMTALFGWYFQQKLESFDRNMINVASLTTAMQILTESVGLHVNDADKHQNNTSRVGDNMATLREQSKELRDLQIAVSLLQAQIGMKPTVSNK